MSADKYELIMFAIIGFCLTAVLAVVCTTLSYYHKVNIETLIHCVDKTQKPLECRAMLNG